MTTTVSVARGLTVPLGDGVRAVRVRASGSPVDGASRSAFWVGRAALAPQSPAVLVQPLGEGEVVALPSAPLTAEGLPLAQVGADGFTRVGAGKVPTTELGLRANAPLNGLALFLDSRDLLNAAGHGTAVTVVIEVWRDADALEVITRDVRISFTRPTGVATYLIAANGSYLTLTGVTDDALTYRVTFRDGTTAEGLIEDRPEGVTFLAGDRSPVSVELLDDALSTSGNILVRVSRERPATSPTNALSAWPLPPYLDPTKPNLAALLRAFSVALQIGADDAGDALDVTRAQGADVDRVARYFGVYRLPGERDAELATRVQGALFPNKQSPAGMSAWLATQGAPGAVVEDLGTLLGRNPYMLNGEWRLDGTVSLGSRSVKGVDRPGVFNVRFDTAPPIGWEKVRALVDRAASAGMIGRIVHTNDTQASVLGRSRADLTARARSAVAAPTYGVRLTVTSSRLQLNGRWDLTGAQEIDSDRNGPPTVDVY